ncbi:MAG: alginate O-acetyltransferase AlgX-related protein, partial [Chloroflexota bacterium]
MTDDRSIPLADPDTHLTGHLPAPARERSWRLIDRLVVVAFCLGLVLPAALLAAGKRSAEIENRPLLKPPAFSLGGLLDPAWYSGIDRFLTDNDALRPTAVRLRGEAYWKLGGTGNPAVVKGRGTWLFTNQEIDARCDLSAADIAAALDRMKAAFTSAGQDFRFILAPDKHSIYPEMVDPGSGYPAACTDERRAPMAAALNARSRFAIDGWAALRAARASDPLGPLLYYTQDSHWTPTGARAAIRPLIESFGSGLW